MLLHVLGKLQGDQKLSLWKHQYSTFPTYESSSCELSKMRTCVRVSNHVKFVHVSCVHCHVYESSTSGCAFVYFTVQDCIEYSSTVSLFQAQDVRSMHKSSSDVAGTNVLFKVLYFKMKNVFLIFCVCLLLMYYLCEKYYKPIPVQYYIADCVSWVPRLTLLDLWTKWT